MGFGMELFRFILSVTVSWQICEVWKSCLSILGNSVPLSEFWVGTSVVLCVDNDRHCQNDRELSYTSFSGLPGYQWCCNWKKKVLLGKMEFSPTTYFPDAVCSYSVLPNNGGTCLTWLMVSKFYKRIFSYAI